MSNSREDSPDWLRSFQPPTKSAIELSSGSLTPSEHSLSDNDDNDDDRISLSRLFKKAASHISDIDDNGDGRESTVSKPVKGKSPERTKNVKQTPERKRKKNENREKEGTKGTGNSAKRTPRKPRQPHVQSHSIWSLSSDSESTPNANPARTDGFTKESKKETDYDLLENERESLLNQASNVKSPRKKMVKEKEKISNEKTEDNPENDAKNNVVREDVSGKHPGPQATSSRLPLLLSEKVQHLKALVECEGDSIDLSGDVGAVGRVVISDDLSSNHEMLLDLKGTIYKTTIVPSRTFCVVSFSQSEAKIEAIMNDFIQLKPQSNVNEAETMVEGTLDGFSFDSDDEIDNLPKAIAQTDQNEVAEDQTDVKTKRAKKTSGVTRKNGKSAGGKPSKKMKKKPLIPKQRKTKK